MRIFTSGKNGIPFFLFALFLFSGTYSYGQTCPTVNETTQSFCGLATVADLAATDNGDGVAWYDDQNSTEIIPGYEDLVDGKIYYAGTPTGTNCAGSREAVTVTITIDRPTPIGNDQIYSPSIGTTANPDPLTIADLRSGLPLVSKSGYTIEYFTSESDPNAQPLADSFVLQPQTSYYAGYVSTTGSCESARLSLLYDPEVVVAPTGPTSQTVCAGTTLIELEASGTNRWYRTATSTSPIQNFENYVAQDGTTYYATQIIPGVNNEPPYESVDRLAVTIAVTPAVITESTQGFCASIGTGNNFDVPRVENLAPADAIFYAETNSATPIDPQTELENGEDYFYAIEGSECGQNRVTVEIYDTPNAGRTTQVSFCSNASPLDLVDFIQESQTGNGPPDRDGSFDPPLKSGTHTFDPSAYAPGTYNFDYVVQGNTNCPTDKARITVTVVESPNAGTDINETICSSALEDQEALIEKISSYLEGRDQTGTFNPTLQELYAQYLTNPIGTFITTYTVDNGNDVCEPDTAQISLTIVETPDAGEDATVTLTEEDTDPVDLFEVLGGTPDADGVWTDAGGNTADGTFDPTTESPGDYTYTVSNGDCSDAATVTIIINPIPPCPDVTMNEQSFCESIPNENDDESHLPMVSDLMPASAVWFATADATEPLAPDTLLEEGGNYFAGTSDGNCGAREMVTVTIEDSPNAGSTTSITVCEGDAAFDILNVLEPSIVGPADQGGIITPALASGSTIFDPAVDAGGQYKYSVQSTNEFCDDDIAFIYITVTSAADAGADTAVEFCTTQGPQNLIEFLPEGADTNGTFEGLENNTFDPALYEIGEYTFTYTVSTEGGCVSEDSSEFTVTLSDAPAGPEASDASFCVVEAATVADLTATGDNIKWYLDEATNMPAAETDLLVEGAYYVTQTTAGGCESMPTMIEVTLNDGAAPTLVQEGNVFCEFDNPTIADLQNNIQEDGTITFYDAATGGSELNSSTSLQNGTTYYAALTDATTGCESSERLAITVTLETCEIVIPEIFTPNGDGLNDRFVIPNLAEQYPNYKLEIYNRWGNLIFQGNSSTPDWGGVSSESALGDNVVPNGVYFYILYYNDGETEPVQGRLYLNR